ncbi:MAG: hypothetical protein QCH99_09605 [Candidatus Bathyarchaeota archaeon]|nr:hypothetical protein [Candidatus Bathyarchaeum tardum]
MQQTFLVTRPFTAETPDVYVGIDAAYDDLPAIKELITELKSHTNMFIIGCTGITYDQNKLDETCQYIYDHGMYFIIYSEHSPQTRWIETAKNRWGDLFLGYYAYDEAGGRQLDQVRFVVSEAENITDASDKFVQGITNRLDRFTSGFTESFRPSLFTSDYALYWFDYEAGYDVLLAQFGWNLSRQLNIALCRGAATVQDKSWGVIVTWTYLNTPHIESGEELYNDLILAYNNGAKYITIFDSNEPYTAGILQDEHIQAIKQFWQYTQENPRTLETQNKRVAFVLPKDYAYGFRGPKDKIWGLWEADDFSYQLSATLGGLLEEYNTTLDIIYEDALESNNTLPYEKLIFWN